MFGISGHPGKRVAVADIGSGSAGVAIISIQDGKPAHIESLHRSILPLEERTPAAVMSGLKNALSESAAKAMEKAGVQKGALESVYAIIRAPWVRSKTICASRKFAEETRITNEIISTLGKEALQGDKELDHQNLIEANIIRAELNGYPTGNPVKKRAHIVTLFTLIAECEPRIKTLVEETLTRAFSRPPKLRSGTGALLSSLRERSAMHTSYLVVDMTSTATSIFAVHKGSPTHHMIVPEGTQTILKRLAGKKMPEETLSMMRMIARDHCEDAACEEVKGKMAEAEQGLIKTFGEAMAELAKTEQLPNALLLITEPAMSSWLTEFFSRIDFTQFTKTAQPFSVEALSSADIRSLVAATETVDDIGLLVASAFVNSELNA